MNPISIGKLKFDRPLFMAPMEGITDVPFRKMVRKHGCGITCTQMVHAEAMLLAPTGRLDNVTAMMDDEKPVGFQICSPDPKLIGEASKIAEQKGAAFIDINMGCPAKNVVNRGAGAALLKTPDLVRALVRSVVHSVSIPVTVKTRAGWDATYKAGPLIAKIAEEEGAQLISIHTRTRSQGHTGEPDWSFIQELKNVVKIPVVGNGGVFAPEDVGRMLEKTGADGVMIARGALGNPWIFSEKRPTVREIKETILDHLEEHLKYYDNKDRALITFRKHIAWYSKGLRNGAEFRVKLFKEKSHENVVKFIQEFFDQLDPLSYPSFD